MARLLLFALTLLFCLAPAAVTAQDAKQKSFSTQEDLSVKSDRDRFEGLLTLLVGPIVLKDESPTEKLAMVIAAVADEKTPTRYSPPSFRFVIASAEGYGSLRVIFLADGERVDFPPARLAKRSVQIGGVAEMWDVDLPADDLRKLAGGKKVEGRVGVEEFILREDQLKALREFVRRLG